MMCESSWPLALETALGCEVIPMIGFIRRMLPAGRYQRIVAKFAFVPILRDPYGLIRQAPVRSQVRQMRCPCMGSVIKKRRKKMSKHKYRKRIKANRHKKK